MPSININSSNITSFGWSASVNIYLRSITFNLLPFTTGPNLAGRPVAFSVVDSDGVTLAAINWATPQIPNAGTTTSWVLDLSSVNFPFLFQTYEIYAAIQDTGGQVYQTNVVYPNLCQPNNLSDSGYVPGLFALTPDCINSVLTVQEITLMVYNNLQPQSVTKTGTLTYPPGTVSPLSFSRTPFTSNVVYTGQYGVQCTSVATYAIGQDVYVLVSYITAGVFNATCNNKMSAVLCCIQKVQQTAIRECNNAIGANAKQQLIDISMFVLSGFMKQSSGQDAQFEVDYIKKYLSCDCGSGSLSQSEFTPINPAVTSIVLNGVGGTSIPSPTPTGNTLTYDIGSNVYQIVKGNTGDLAFTIMVNTAISNTVQYIITFNYDTMAGYILTAIQNDPTLLAQLNSLVTAAGSILGLNGLCVINTSQVNYSLSQAVTGSTLLANIVINGNTFTAPANLFGNNPTAVASWLNSLTLGTFSATVTSGTLTILSVNNTNIISTLTFTSPNVTQQFQATSVTLVQVLQAIINFLCNLTALQVALGNALTVCTLDYNNNVVQTTYQANTTQQAYNGAVANAICNLCARINSLVAFTCAKLQALFSDNPNAAFSYANDRFLSIVGGACTTLTAKQAALAFISAVNADPQTKTAFCAINCTIPATCPDISNVNLSALGKTSIGFYGVTWSQTPTANQTVTVRYRISGTMTWMVSSNNVSLFPNGNINGVSPYPIIGLTQGTTYDIWIQNNCGGNGFITQVTTLSNTVYSGSFRLDNILYNICGESPVTLYSETPFGTGATMCNDPGFTSLVTGFTYIVSATGEIFFINSTSGVVGADTGSNCLTGTAGTYILGTSSGTVCSGTPVTLYTNGPFTVGSILYRDSALTTPVTESTFVVQSSSNTIYNLNSSTGVVGSTTGLSCNGVVFVANGQGGTNNRIISIGGIPGFSLSSFLDPTQNQSGTHGAFTAAVSITTGLITGGYTNGNAALIVNGTTIQCINIDATGMYSFASTNFNATDLINIILNNGDCS